MNEAFFSFHSKELARSESAEVNKYWFRDCHRFFCIVMTQMYSIFSQHSENSLKEIQCHLGL